MSIVPTENVKDMIDKMKAGEDLLAFLRNIVYCDVKDGEYGTSW